MLVVDLPFALESKSNFRRFRSDSPASWDRFKRFERDTRLVLTAARPSDWVVGDSSAPLASRPVVVAAVWARSLLDAGNFSKSVLDAAEGVLFVSDASVTAVTSVGVRAKTNQHARLGFAQLPPGSATNEVVRALNALSLLVVPEV